MTQTHRDSERINVRVPDGFRRRLKMRAAQNDRTLGGEVHAMLEKVLSEEETASAS